MTLETGTGRSDAARRTRRTSRVVFAASVVLLGLNLRPALSGVSPVLRSIQNDLQLSGAAASLLLSLPVACFGVAAFLAPVVVRRTSLIAALRICLFALALGLAVRAAGSTSTLFAGTAIAAVAIAVANVLGPAIVKLAPATDVPALMSLYLTSMAGGATVAAVTALPVERLTRWEWQASLGMWAIPALVTGGIFIVSGSAWRTPRVEESRMQQGLRLMMEDPLAWGVTGFLALSSLSFYTSVAWLPEILTSRGATRGQAALLFAAFSAMAIPSSFVVPTLAARGRDQRRWALSMTVLTGVGLVAVLASSGMWMAAAVLVLGVGQASSFSLAMTFIVLRAATAGDAARLSAMSQGIGFILASLGPIGAGLLHDASGGWWLPVGVLGVFLVPQVAMGVAAGANSTVREQKLG